MEILFVVHNLPWALITRSRSEATTYNFFPTLSRAEEEGAGHPEVVEEEEIRQGILPGY